MGAWQQLLQSLFPADGPLAAAGPVAAAVCALLTGLALVLVASAVARRLRRSGRHEEAGGKRAVKLPEVSSASDVRVLRHTVRNTAQTRPLIRRVEEIEANQPVTVRLGDGSMFNSFILGVTGTDVHLTVPLNVPIRERLPREERVRVSFTRPHDARYEFTSRVVAEHDGEDGVLVQPTAPLHRIQQRQAARVRCGEVMRFAKVERPVAVRRVGPVRKPQLPLKGRLRDISATGMSFVCDEELKRPTRILLELDLGGRNGPMLLDGVVERQKPLRGTSVSRQETSVRFVLLSPRQEYHLGMLVAELQQHLIRRMRLRTGPAAEAAPRLTPVARESDEDRHAVVRRAKASEADMAFVTDGAATPIHVGAD